VVLILKDFSLPRGSCPCDKNNQMGTRAIDKTFVEKLQIQPHWVLVEQPEIYPFLVL